MPIRVEATERRLGRLFFLRDITMTGLAMGRFTGSSIDSFVDQAQYRVAIQFQIANAPGGTRVVGRLEGDSDFFRLDAANEEEVIDTLFPVRRTNSQFITFEETQRYEVDSLGRRRLIRQPVSRDPAQPEWMTHSLRDHEAVTRITGPRRTGSFYWDYRIRSLPVNGSSALFVADHRVDPVLPIDLEAINYRGRGIFVMRDNTTHFVSYLGTDYYHSAEQFIEEAQAVGVSRRLPRRTDVPWDRLSGASRMILVARTDNGPAIFMTVPMGNITYITTGNEDRDNRTWREVTNDFGDDYLRRAER